MVPDPHGLPSIAGRSDLGRIMFFSISIFAGKRLPVADEGEDFFTFGSTESTGKTLVTGGAGARVELTGNLDWGIIY
jgi:hypothetical protein